MSQSQLKKSSKKAAAPKKSKDELEYNRLTKKVAKAQQAKEYQIKQLDEQLLWINEFIQPKMLEWHHVKLSISECLLEFIPSFTDDEEIRSVLTNYSSQIIDEVEQVPLMIPQELQSRISNLRTIIEQRMKEGLDKMPLDDRKMADELLKETFDELMDELRTNLDMAGIKIDLSDLRYDMSRSEIDNILKERLKASVDENPELRNFHFGHKINKHLSSEDDAKSLGISQLYKKLVKWIHPDLEADVDQKLVKENWMKILTVAYEKQDLSAMLRLETEVIKALDIPSEKLSPVKLKSYNRYLKEMLSEIESDTYRMMMSPKYYALHFYYEPFGGFQFANWSKTELLSSIKEQFNDDKKLLKELTKSEKSRNAKLTAIYSELMAEFEGELWMNDEDDMFGLPF